jgi:hypothetical protein
MGIGREPAVFTRREITRFEMLHRVLNECEDCNERVFGGGFGLDSCGSGYGPAARFLNALMNFRGFSGEMSDS